MKHLLSLRKALQNSSQKVFILETQDIFFTKQAMSIIKQSLNLDFCEEVFDIEDGALDKFFLSLRTPPFLNPRKLIVLYGLEHLKDPSLLGENLERLAHYNMVVLYASHLDRRKKTWNAFLKKYFVLSFPKLKSYEKADWVQWLCHRYKMEVNKSLCVWLSSFLPDDLGGINSEIKKIKTFLGKKEKESCILQEKDIKEILFKQKNDTLFDLGHLLAQKNLHGFLIAIKKFLDQGESSVALIIFLARHFRLLLKVKEGLEKGLKYKALADFVRIPPFFLNQYLDEVKLWSKDGLKNNLIELYNLDKELKTKGALSEFLWDRFARSRIKFSFE